ncbi:Hypothetical_protein [Hexamita inflata]|uniref:Hypothetical_protein n=1 Tax=Hexamita inflata TaxID=28002 RepID=A0AA86NT92_9EUKA|nr:Hypothetical protein HINF_LOCUS12071 [Hexamita inflata]
MISHFPSGRLVIQPIMQLHQSDSIELRIIKSIFLHNYAQQHQTNTFMLQKLSIPAAQLIQKMWKQINSDFVVLYDKFIDIQKNELQMVFDLVVTSQSQLRPHTSLNASDEELIMLQQRKFDYNAFSLFVERNCNKLRPNQITLDSIPMDLVKVNLAGQNIQKENVVFDVFLYLCDRVNGGKVQSPANEIQRRLNQSRSPLESNSRLRSTRPTLQSLRENELEQNSNEEKQDDVQMSALEPQNNTCIHILEQLTHENHINPNEILNENQIKESNKLHQINELNEIREKKEIKEQERNDDKINIDQSQEPNNQDLVSDQKPDSATETLKEQNSSHDQITNTQTKDEENEENENESENKIKENEDQKNE